MVSAIGSSLAGLNSAAKRIETAAANIAKQNTTEQPKADPAQDLVDIKIAAYDYKANLSAIKVQDKMQQSLLDILT